MMLTASVEPPSEHPVPKARRRRPRAALACRFCRRRKTRCSGHFPTCTLCAENGIQCQYEPVPQPHTGREKQKDRRQTTGAPSGSVSNPDEPSPTAHLQSLEQSRRTSAEPGEIAFDNGLHVGQTSGVSFLYRGGGDRAQVFREGDPDTPLSSYGDVPLPRATRAEYPTMTEATSLLDHYFSFATPTFRFLHRQTLEETMTALLQGQKVRAAESACVLMIWAQALLYRDEANVGESTADRRSISYFDQARDLLEHESGPAQVASVEARLAACLYLLSTSRVHTCRFLFAFTHTLVITLALHRKTSRRYETTPLTSERRRRAFWSFYIIDGYLSVLLGQPRHIRDEDIDQPYPANVDDRVLHSATDLSKVPHHGNLEALVNHAKLARILARTNDLLYPIIQLSRDEIIQRAETMTFDLQELEDQLPPFLHSRFEASLGTQTWERQNSVLGLAIAHARIIATRRTILLDSSSEASIADTMSDRHEQCVRVCLRAICTMLDHVYPMMQHGKLRRGFWLTQYVTMCAISTLFVYKLQRKRGRMLHGQDMDLELYFGRANDVQEHMASIAAAGSTAKRHHALFARLKQQTKENPQRAAVQGRTPGMQQDASQQSLNFPKGPIGRDVPDEFQMTDPLPEQFTPGSMFDTAFADASSWQYLDQLLPDGFDLSLGMG